LQSDRQLEAVKSARSIAEWALMAANPGHLIKAYRDLVLLDRDDQICGIVDDIEAAAREPGIWQMTALLVGPAA